MSAIVGAYALDGRPVDRAGLERMANTLAHRGPDGIDIWNKGSVGLGHGMLWTTRESLQERLPLINQTGDLVLTADARIDNRDELIAALGLTHRLPQEIADSELILAAYEKWGERCPEKLQGDFVFAIWDRRKRALFCARDHFGVKSFYYYRSNQLFAFASEIKALLCLPEVPRRLNEVRVADYLAMRFEDQTITFYQDIWRLPPAHSIMVAPQKAQLRHYWSLDPSRELRLGSDDEYAEAFREIFTEAVHCRLRSAFPVGTELSGGLDSSSVTCVARDLLAGNGNLPLHTFSAIFDDVPQCDERPFINMVLAQGNLKPHYVRADQLSPLANADHLMWLQDEPLYIHNLFMSWGLFSAAQQQGIRVLLDGEDGDNVVSHGDEYLAELAHAGQWTAFATEVNALSQRSNASPWPYLQYYGLTHLTKLVRGGKWVAFAQGVNEIPRHFDISRSNLFLNYGLKRLAPEPLQRVWRTMRGSKQSAAISEQGDLNPTINHSFARRIALKERIQDLQKDRPTPSQTAREEHCRNLSSGFQSLANEVCDRLAASVSIEQRHPFFDKRLVEFCLALPPQQKLNQGWDRVVLRRAMAGILPQKVQWRGDKSDLSANFARGLLNSDRGLLEKVILDDPGSIEQYVDVSTLRKVYRQFSDRQRTRDGESVIWPAVTLALWLRCTGLTT